MSILIDNQLLLKFIRAYLTHRPLFYAFIRPQEALLFKYHQSSLKHPILDFGCGDGFFAHLIFGRHAIDVGLDVSQSRIAETKNWPAYKKVVTYNGTTIPYPNNYFQSIISNCVFEHLPDLEENVKEMYRVLKPGGSLHTSVATNHWEQHFLGSRLLGNSYIKWWRRIQVHFNLFSLAHWQKVFVKAGFKVTEKHGYVNPDILHRIEIAHYLALPQLVAYKLVKRWTLFHHHSPVLKLQNTALALTSQALKTPPQSSGAVYFVLTKPA